MDSKKTQKVVVVILVVTAFLGIVGALLVYYLSVQEDADQISRDQREFCACIKAYTTPECNDCNCTQIESQALESSIAEVINNNCPLDCGSEPQEENQEIIECLIPQVRESNCHSISIRNSNTRELLTPPIPAESPVLITANFVPRKTGDEEENFTRYVFVINGVSTEINANEIPSTMINDQKTYVPEIEFDNFQDVDTLTVQAVGYSDKDPEGSSPNKYCYRRYDLTQTRGALCSNLIAETREGPTPNTTIISSLELTTPNLEQGNEVSIEFKFDHEGIESVRTENIPRNLLEEILVNEKIILEYSHLYTTPNLYVGGESLPILNANNLDTDNVSISTQLYVNNNLIDSGMCTENIALIGGTFDPDPDDPDDPDPDEPDDEDIETDLKLTMEGPQCARKAEDEDSVSRIAYRITATNNSEAEEVINNITNKLPLGFKYIGETTTINGVPTGDSILDITSIGESQELVWKNAWTIQPNSSLILEYAVNVTHNAIDGENQNEAVISPVNIPENMDNLRAEFVTIVSDDCEIDGELPDTGNLTYISFIIGLIALIFGTLVYQGKINTVDKAILYLANTKSIKKRLMTPQEYLEENILEEEEKED